jgi:lysophospholipase
MLRQILFHDNLPEGNIIFTVLDLNYVIEVPSMYYSPNKNPLFIPDKEFEKEYPALEASILPYAHTGRLASYDGLELEYEYYLAENATASVVIVHGFTEFIRKYREMCRFFLDLGFNVFVYDQRGHGLSGRETDDYSKAHVSSFDAYVRDLEQIIDRLVLPISSQPLYLFSHSMGGAISALYMQLHPTTIKGAIMSAPMIRPRTHNVPLPIMKVMLSHDSKKYGWDVPFRGAKKFNADAVLEYSSDQSRGRFQMNMETRISNTCYQNAEITNGWLIESLKVYKKICNKSTRQIETDVLILSAECDRVVFNNAQEKFSSLLPHSTMITIEQAKHNLANGSDFILSEFYNAIKDFCNK